MENEAFKYDIFLQLIILNRAVTALCPASWCKVS